jgi:hypothetical protein
MDPAFWSTGHHHKRQRPTIYIFIVGQPLLPPLHQAHTDHRLPSSVERPCGAVPLPPEGCPPSQSSRSGLGLTHSLGIVGVQDSSEGRLRFLTFRSCFRFAVGFARAVSFYASVAVAVVHPGLPRRPGWPPTSADCSQHYTFTHIPSRRSPVGSLCAGSTRRRPAAAVAAL